MSKLGLFKYIYISYIKKNFKNTFAILNVSTHPNSTHPNSTHPNSTHPNSKNHKKKNAFKKRSKRKPAIPRRKQHKSVARKYKGGEPLPFDFNKQLKETKTNTPYLINDDNDLTKAYFLKCPEAETRENTYFVFEKIYDCSMFNKLNIVSDAEDAKKMMQNRWMAVNGAMHLFSTDGCYSLYKMIPNLQTHHVYMVYVVETPFIEQWFKSNTIDGTKIHITMLAFVPKKDYDKKPFAVHYYIDKDTWNRKQPNPIKRLGVMLHGFSATMVRHITGKEDIRIVSAPNEDMLGILKWDMKKHPDYYELDTDTADTSNSPDVLTTDYVFDENNKRINCCTLEFSFATGHSISIHSARLENRFKAIYNSFASKCKTEYSECISEEPAPSGYLENVVNVSDSLKHRQFTINVLKNIVESDNPKQRAVTLKRSLEEVLKTIEEESKSPEHSRVTFNVLKNVLKEYE